MKYIIVSNEGIDGLEREVNNKIINEGFVPLGGVCFVQMEKNDNRGKTFLILFLQSMIKDEVI